MLGLDEAPDGGTGWRAAGARGGSGGGCATLGGGGRAGAFRLDFWDPGGDATRKTKSKPNMDADNQIV